jgi:hypothetical protein
MHVILENPQVDAGISTYNRPLSAGRDETGKENMDGIQEIG